MSAHWKRSARYAIYARYSTENQRQASIKDQIHDCRRHVEREGGTVDEALVFVDAAASGATMQRKGLTQLLTAADAGRFDVLVVEDVSRLSRDTADATVMLRRFEQRGVKIVGVADGVDTSTANGAVVFQIGAVFAEQQREAGRQRTRRGLEGRAREGFATGRLPYGYRSEPVADDRGRVIGKRVMIDERRAKVVHRVFVDYGDGKSLAAIAKTLNNAGVPAPSPGRGRGWSPASIRDMLHNEAYVGRWSYSRTEWRTDPVTNKRRPRPRAPEDTIRREDETLRIIEKALWAMTQQRLAAVRACYAGKRNCASTSGRANMHLLSGLLRCAECGTSMTVHSGSSASYYTCSAARKRGTCTNRISLREDETIDAVLGHLREIVTSPAARAYLETRVTSLLATGPGTEDLAIHQETIEELDRKIGKLVAFIEGGEAGEGVRGRLRELENQRAAAAQALENERTRLLQISEGITVPMVLAQSADLRRVLEVDPVRARERLRSLFEHKRLLVRVRAGREVVLEGKLTRGSRVVIRVGPRS